MFSIRNIKFASIEHAHNARLLAKTKYFEIRFIGSNMTLLAGKVLNKKNLKKLLKKCKCKNDIPGDGHAPNMIPYMVKEF